MGHLGIKLYLVTDLIFRSQSWLKTTFWNEHGREGWCPGCPGPWACQMVAACFLPELCRHPEAPGALGPVSWPQAASVAYSSLLYKYYHFLCTSWYEKILRSTGVRWLYRITRGRVWGYGWFVLLLICDLPACFAENVLVPGNRVIYVTG